MGGEELQRRRAPLRGSRCATGDRFDPPRPDGDRPAARRASRLHGSVGGGCLAFRTGRGATGTSARQSTGLTTRVVPFNDVAALEAALADRRGAAFLIEPALTNVGIVLPDPGYHDAVREITRRTGTLLIIDETHTICAGPGGMTKRDGLDPDLFVIGKTIGGGIPAATYGFSEAVAAAIEAGIGLEDADVGGIGGTLAGYALSLAAVRATLGEVLTDAAFEQMIPLAERWTAGSMASSPPTPCHGASPGSAPGPSTTSCRRRRGRTGAVDHSDYELDGSSTCTPSTGGSS